MVLSENVIELHADGPQLELAPRSIDPADWARFGANLGEILEAFGLPPDTPGTRETPERFLRAL